MKSHAQQGMSLILVIVILSGVLVLGLTASQLVLRESASVSGIEQSEIAYYAAEAGAERMLYAYNKQYPRRLAAAFTDTCMDLDSTGFNLETILDAWWKEISFALMTQTSPWTVTIPAGKTSFEYALDLNVDSGTPYPNNLKVQRQGGGAAKVVVLQIDKNTGVLVQQAAQSDTPFTYAPGPGPSDDFDFTQYVYRIKIVEDAGGPAIYTITNSPASRDLIVGFLLTTCGQYQNVAFERRLEIEHQKWAAY